MQRTIHTPAWIAAAALGLAVLVGVVTGTAVHSSTVEPIYTVAGDTGTSGSLETGFSPVVRSAAPAVVNISSSRVVRTEPSQANPGEEELLRRFFGDDFMRQFRVPRERRERSLGSGVIVNADGYILTNSHVVSGASNVKVALSDDRELPGEVVGNDPGTDIAVVKIAADHLSILPFADSSKVEVGDIALAIGNPFGLGRTVTMGIVSATGRGGLGIEEYEDFIQTDASINPGNSGGALVNARGQLIGINTAILSPSGGSLGIGFAVPSNMARDVMDQIVRTGKVTRGYLGVVVQDITPELAKAMKIDQTRGALISDIDTKGPAARSGLEAGDVILEANGKAVEDQRALRLMVSSMAPGSQVNLRVLHDGQSRNVTMTLGEMPAREPAAESRSRQKQSTSDTTQPRLGIAVTELTREIAEQLQIPAGVKGIVVADVEDGSPAAEAGLQTGDVIQEVNQRVVPNVGEFRTEISRAGSDTVLLKVNRQGHSTFVAIPPQ